MAEISLHPEFEFIEEYYEECFDLIEKGDSKTVKLQKTTYLPKLESMLLDGATQGDEDYNVFLQNAVWRDIPKESLSEIVGVMFEKKSTFNLPEYFKDYLTSITSNGQGLSFLEALATFGQLIYGKVGLMASPVTDLTGQKLPVVTIHDAPTIINWHQSVDGGGKLFYDMVTIRSITSEYNEETHAWTDVVYFTVHEISPEGNYYSVVISEADYYNYNISYAKRASHETYIEPEFKGRKINKVPFVVINLTNVDDFTEIPPLYEQAKLAVACYNASALYRKKFRQQVWALLLLSGFKTENDIHGGIKSDGVLASKNHQATGKYITPDSESLVELKLGVRDLKVEAEMKGIVISEKNSAESGNAIELRKDNQVNEYKTLAETRTKGIVKLLGIIQEWGFSGKVDISWITPFTDFSKFVATPKELLELSELVERGKLPEDDFFDYCKRNGYTKYKDFVTFKQNLTNGIYDED